MKRLIIEKGKVIFSTHIAEDVSIVCEEGKIRDIIPSDIVSFSDTDERIEAHGPFSLAYRIKPVRKRRLNSVE
ncbi:MAG: hypothetical protein WCZ43_11365 [Proteiniphilum sp.]